MAAAEFEELDEFLDDTLTLPINGKRYVVPAPSGRDGLWAQRVVETVRAAKAGGDVDAGRLDDGDERLLYERMLGPAFEEMLADDVSWSRISHAGMTVFFWTTIDRATAHEFWTAGGDPEALGSAESTPNRASRRASAAAARTTKPPASTSGTRAPKTSAARKTRGSSGPTSSASGAS